MKMLFKGRKFNVIFNVSSIAFSELSKHTYLTLVFLCKTTWHLFFRVIKNASTFRIIWGGGGKSLVSVNRKFITIDVANIVGEQIFSRIFFLKSLIEKNLKKFSESFFYKRNSIKGSIFFAVFLHVSG